MDDPTEASDPTETPDGPGGEPSDLTREGVAHLQAAGRELIDAGRSFLEVAEELIADPEEVRRTVVAFRETVASLLDQLLAAMEERAPGAGDEGDGGVEKIEVT
jgi:hypothetical protein